ncbi:glycosyl hydrolase [Cohnella sp. 56]|uniref:glycosyl hydrolase n=1 Tax=Cohnella sp. 56 TaxID=3113722 RepID=UPI0030E85F23
MKKWLVAILMVCCFWSAVGLSGPSKAEAATPVNPNASAITKSLLNYIAGLSGKYTLAGQHDKPGSTTAAFNQAKTITGQYPALWGSDMGFTSSGLDTMNNRQGVVNEAKSKWAANSVVTLTWHMCKPGTTAPCSWDGNVYNSPLTSTQWTQIVTPGTTLYNQFISRIDEAVPYLQQLRDAGVPVLWRPFHEMNGSWFWWGGNTTNSKKLYQIMYDRYTNVYGLNNLIWVWNVDRPSSGAPSNYYPGAGYVDILSMDIYDNDFNSSYYNTMVSLAAGKPIALGEVGNLPTPSILDAQPNWAYFMAWTEHLTGSNTNTQIQSTYWASRVITQNEVAVPVAGAANKAYNKSAYSGTVESASYPPSLAVDGNGSTRWASAWQNQDWFYVDLGSVQPMSMVKLQWEAAYAKKFQIQLSNDNISWWTVYTDENGTGGVQYVTFPSTSARYVKLYAYERATTYGYSLYEFEVY